MARSHLVVGALARILPREFRERVFEAAWADIRLEEYEAGQPGSFAARAVFVLECLRVGLPQFFWSHGRATRLARRGLVAAAVIAGLFVLIRVGYANPGY